MSIFTIFAQPAGYQFVETPYTQFSQPAVWHKTNNMPSPKAEAGSVVYNNLLYVFGGISGFIDKTQTKPRKRYRIVFNNTAEFFNPQTQQWTSLKPLPGLGMSHYGICLVDDKVWFVGGRLAPDKSLTDQVWLYDIPKNEWEQGPSLPLKLASGALLKLGRKLHFFAGGTHSIFSVKRFNTLTQYHLILDLDNVKQGWRSFDSNFPAEAQTIHASYINLMGKFYLIGGQDGHDGGNQDHKQVFEYNPALNRWRRLADLPQKNSHNESSTFVIDGRLLTLAGENNGNKILEYDLQKNQWLVLDSLLNECNEEMKLIGTSAKVIDNQLIIAGGGLKSKNYHSVSAVYMKKFVRKPISQIGFSADTLKVVFDYKHRQTTQKSAWLWALGGKKEYELDMTQLPDWIQLKGKTRRITDENADELEFVFNPQNLTSPKSTFQLKAQTNTGESARLIIEVNILPAPAWWQAFLTPSMIDTMLLGLFGLLLVLLGLKYFPALISLR